MAHDKEPGKFQLRPALDSDVPAIRVLVNEAYRELAEMGLNYTATYQDEALTRDRISKGRAFVMEFNRRLIGTVLFTEKNYFTERRTAYVSQLAVDPAFKRAGLGTSLVEYCETLASQEGFEGIQLDTAKPARHLVDWYLRRGYEVVGETQWEGKTYASFIFEKSL